MSTKPRSLHGSTPRFSTLRENSWRVEPGNTGNYMYVGPYVISESMVGWVCLERWVPLGRLAPPGPPGNDGEDRDPGVPGSMGEVVYTHVACLGTVDIWRHKDKCMRSFVISTTLNF